MQRRDGANSPVRPPVTRERLAQDLRGLGITPGQTLIVNASLPSIGWVAGGAPTVVAALREVVGAAGNVVMPSGTEENSLTSRAHRARIAGMSSDEVRAYRMNMPPFDMDTTPSGMGAIGEALRTTVGAVRSTHPQSSFAAVGPDADLLMADHQLESHLGEGSPLAKLYKQDAIVLMIGVGYRYCTAFHLAEYRYTPSPPTQTYACVVATGGRRYWTAYTDVVLDDTEFEDIGESLAAEVPVRRGYAGDAECRLMSLPDAVDFAAKWMAMHRGNPELLRGCSLCKL
jgi:aminoglycoside 3-N-acetyltransferase